MVASQFTVNIWSVVRNRPNVREEVLGTNDWGNKLLLHNAPHECTSVNSPYTSLPAWISVDITVAVTVVVTRARKWFKRRTGDLSTIFAFYAICAQSQTQENKTKWIIQLSHLFVHCIMTQKCVTKIHTDGRAKQKSLSIFKHFQCQTCNCLQKQTKKPTEILNYFQVFFAFTHNVYKSA